MKYNNIIYNFRIILLYLLQKLKNMLCKRKDKFVYNNSDININIYDENFTNYDYAYDADCEDNCDI